MFRLFAIAAVVVAFGATLYFSGDALEAWESPQPSAKASPVAAKKAKAKKRHRQRAASRTHARRLTPNHEATWLNHLNALCRHSEDEAAAIPLPITAEGGSYYFRQVVQVARRFNQKAEVLIRRVAASADADRLARLFDQEESLMQDLLTAAEQKQVDRLRRIAPALVAVGKSENKIFAGLGARDCTASDDPFRA
jgi:hypothetical protein